MPIRSKSAATKRVVEDEEDYAPAEEKPRRRRPVEDAEPDERPRRSREVEPDEDEDEAPKKASREGIVRKGWAGAREVADASSTSFANQLKLEDGKPVVIKYLEDEPYASYFIHWMERKGKRSFTCIDNPKTGVRCPLCGIGDTPRAVYCFNVALLDPKEGTSLRTWDVGIRLFNQMKSINSDPKVGLLDPYFKVVRTGKGTSATTTISPVKERDLYDDFDVEPLTDKELRSLQSKAYDEDIIELPKMSALKEIAAEMSTYDDD